MKVKYIGRQDCFSTEYNGKRYGFTKKDPISDIPYAVYDHIKTSGHINAQDLIPVQTDNTELENKVAALEAENEKLLVRIEHLQKQNQKTRKEK